MEKKINVEFTVTELALIFTGLDLFLIEAADHQTDVSAHLLKRIKRHLEASVGYGDAVKATEDLAKKIAGVIEEAVN